MLNQTTWTALRTRIEQHQQLSQRQRGEDITALLAEVEQLRRDITILEQQAVTARLRVASPHVELTENQLRPMGTWHIQIAASEHRLKQALTEAIAKINA